MRDRLGAVSPAADALLQRVAMPSALVNTTVMLMSGFTGQQWTFLLAWIGAVLSYYGHMLLREERQAR